MKVRHVLSTTNRRPVTIHPEANVCDAIAELVNHNIGSLPVLDQTGSLLGIFTERDVLRGIHEHAEDYCHMRIDSVMTRDVETCSPDDSVHEAMGWMSARRIGQLPVVEEGRVVGLVSVGDLIKILHDTTTEENRNLLNYVQGLTS